MKLLFILSFFTFLFHKPAENSVEAKSASAVVSWERNKNLSWMDFKGIPKYTSPFAAECYWEIKYSYSFNPNKNKLYFDVLCFFNASKSWVKPEHRSDALLEHEQMHFNIAELCSRRLRKELTEYKFQKASFKTEINLIFEQTLKECDSLQTMYDEQTNHGLNKKQQKNWVQNVEKELALLDYYEYLPNQAFEGSIIEENFISKLFKKFSLN